MIEKYQSIPFEAIVLAPDMSNWREASAFIGDITEYPADAKTPEYLDVVNAFGYLCEASKNDVILKNGVNQGLEVWPYDEFIQYFQKCEP